MWKGGGEADVSHSIPASQRNITTGVKKAGHANEGGGRENNKRAVPWMVKEKKERGREREIGRASCRERV